LYKQRALGGGRSFSFIVMGEEGERAGKEKTAARINIKKKVFTESKKKKDDPETVLCGCGGEERKDPRQNMSPCLRRKKKDFT